ncbi:MAG: N-formylglutamate amidohydrolase [Boseongicola sp. SB0677_bin_26]|nr:N-formylglutamate amidohydrolase [Boseongicola sp. SB0665_bin_10]MYG28410.1 N-formylglutamate amidohydrolase [Boseongicola sp. SB0677_bin_26]
MFISTAPMDIGEVVRVIPGRNDFETLIVCEHASNRIPRGLQGLGLDEEAPSSQVGWDPGALDVAQDMARRMEAPQVLGAVSRLVYGSNRPSDSPGAMATWHEIPGNRDLSRTARLDRIDAVCKPFHETLAGLVKAAASTLSLLVTVHSFAPVFRDRPWEVENGIFHGKDDRLARTTIDVVPEGFSFGTRLNETYSAADGVAHTIDRHGAANELLNVIIEIRSDLIRTTKRKLDMADRLVAWIQEARAGFGRDGIA